MRLPYGGSEPINRQRLERARMERLCYHVQPNANITTRILQEAIASSYLWLTPNPRHPSAALSGRHPTPNPRHPIPDTLLLK